MMLKMKNILVGNVARYIFLWSILCFGIDSGLSANENLVTSTGTEVRVRFDQKSSNNYSFHIQLTFNNVKIEEKNLGNSLIRLKVGKYSGKTYYDIILNSKLSKLSFDDKSNNGGDGNSYEGWKLWMNKYDSNTYGLRKKLPKHELQALRGICENLASTENIKKYIGANISKAYDPKKMFRYPDRVYKEFALVAKRCASSLKKSAPKANNITFVALKKPIPKCKMSALVTRRAQKAMKEMGLYSGQIDSKMGPGTISGMKKGEFKISK